MLQAGNCKSREDATMSWAASMGDAVVADAPVAAALVGCADDFRRGFQHPLVLLQFTARSWDSTSNLHLQDAAAGRSSHVPPALRELALVGKGQKPLPSPYLCESLHSSLLRGLALNLLAEERQGTSCPNSTSLAQKEPTRFHRD